MIAVSPLRPPAGLWRWLTPAFLFLAIASLAVPPFLVEMPPVLDYPNHYARLWLLAGGVDQPPLAQMYALDWSRAWTNILIDLAAATVGRVTGVDFLAPALLALSIALPVIGAALLHRTIFGMWSWWQIGMALAGFGMTSLAGFMNFQIGLGLALLCSVADIWLAKRSRPGAWAFRAFATAGLLVAHPFAALFFAILVAAIALGPTQPPVRQWPAAWPLALRAAVAVIPIVAPVLLFMWLAPSKPSPIGVGPYLEWDQNYLRKWASVLMTGVRTYSPMIDLPMVLFLVAPVYHAWRLKRFESHAGLALAAGLLFAVSLLMPTRVGDSFWMDRRLPMLALFIYLAAVNPLAATARDAIVAACAALVLVLLKTTAVGWVWIERQDDIRALQRVLAHVPAGSAVLPAHHLPPDSHLMRAVGRHFYDGRMHEHYSTLVIPWRGAFSPQLFTRAGRQPVEVLPPWDRIEGSDESPLLLSELGGAPTPPYARDWRRDFDYLLILDADMPDVTRGGAVPADLVLIDNAGFAKLYRIPRPVAKPSEAAP